MITSDIKKLLGIPICLHFCVQLTDTIICPKEQNTQIKTLFDPLELLLVVSFFTISSIIILLFIPLI